jgi:Zn-dependent M28 family amino/carboxypeptidase
MANSSLRFESVVLFVAACSGGTPADIDAPPIDPSATVESSRLMADLTTITGPRPADSAHWQQVQDLCATRLMQLGYAVERQTYATGVNVIGTRTGTSKANERVVVATHYDGVANCPAADDNGTGVAATLEAARVLAMADHARTLVVACFDEEELGLIGSKAYVARVKSAGEQIVAAIIFEMLGYRSAAANSQTLAPGLDLIFPQQATAITANQSRGDFIAVIHDTGSTAIVADFTRHAVAVGLPTIVLPLTDAQKKSPQLSDLRRSDHAPFWDANFPALQLTDTANFRNPHYHCAGGLDSVSDIDADFFTKNVKASVGAAADALDR